METYIVTNANLTFLDILFSPFNIFSAIKFRRIVKKFDPDIIHVHNFVFKLSPSFLIVIPKRVKILLTIHNYRFLCPSGTLYYKGEINLESKHFLGLIKNVLKGVYSNSVFKTTILALIFRINFVLGTFSRIDKFIFLTPFSKAIHQNWRKSLFTKSMVKPNFLVGDQPKKANGEIDLLFVGRLTEEKGILDVLPILIKNTHLNIMIVGDGPLNDKIKNNCADSKHIQIIGHSSREKILKLISRSKILLFPSKWYEGMPMTIIEAFSVGTPVIARRIGAMKSMIEKERTGFFYNNSEELDHLLKRIKTVDVDKLSHYVLEEYSTKYNEDIGMKNLKNMIEQFI